MEKKAGDDFGHVIGIPVSSSDYGAEGFAKPANNLARGIKEHVSLGGSLGETVKGKLSLGTRILKAGGIGRVFEQSFALEQGERLIRASQCHLSTTAGPIAGMLFVSTARIAFRSDKSVAVTAFDGGVCRLPYKACVPLERVRKASESKNVDKPEQKYIRVATVDGFELWFMGFVNFQKSLCCIQEAVAQAQ